MTTYYSKRPVTIFYRNGFGSMNQVEAKLVSTSFEKRMYDAGTISEVRYLLPRKRKESVIRGNKCVIIVDGVGLPDITNDSYIVKSDSEVTIKASRYASFDPRFVSDFLENFTLAGLDDKILFKDIDPSFQ